MLFFLRINFDNISTGYNPNEGFYLTDVFPLKGISIVLEYVNVFEFFVSFVDLKLKQDKNPVLELSYC